MCDEPEILFSWKARKVQPIVIGYVLAVFLGFILLALFVFHSTEAAFALVTTAFGSLVPLVPMALNRVEYQFTEKGLRKRTMQGKKPGALKEVFSWDDVSRITPMKHGFKFFRRIEEKGRFRRFWKTHLTEGGSGEFHIEPGEGLEVREILTRRGLLPPVRTIPDPGESS